MKRTRLLWCLTGASLTAAVAFAVSTDRIEADEPQPQLANVAQSFSDAKDSESLLASTRAADG